MVVSDSYKDRLRKILWRQVTTAMPVLVSMARPRTYRYLKIAPAWQVFTHCDRVAGGAGAALCGVNSVFCRTWIRGATALFNRFNVLTAEQGNRPQ